ncbi:MAG TPA: HRDC domain-containing protein [Candidatus Baltobacteraceae bacterium]|nr:HRDC domain-containing protein [Candidatus Baltobacteraceae bacterium]
MNVSNDIVPMIDSRAGLDALCERIRASSRVALDTEFHAERSYAPRLMVVQLAFDDGAVIVDPLAVPDLHPLLEALGSVTLVGHALSSDLKIFAERFGMVPPNVFDSQVAAAFLGYGMQISLADLVRDLQDVRLAKTQTVSDWSTRPFTPRQIEYLVDDVAHLLPMHDKLTERLQRAGRLQWAIEESALLGDLERYRADERRAYIRIPGAMRMNRRELAVLSEMVKLRERVAKERDLPVKYIMPDDVVSGLATLKPRAVTDLEQLRRLDAGARRQLGSAIVEGVTRAMALPEDELPARPQRPLGPNRDTVASVMGVLVGEIARMNDLPQSLLVSRATLERLAREVPAERAAFDAALDVSPWRLALVGDPLWRLLSGELRLEIEGYAEGDPKIRLSP